MWLKFRNPVLIVGGLLVIALITMFALARITDSKLRKELANSKALLELQPVLKAANDSLEVEVISAKRSAERWRNISARHRAAQDSLGAVLDSLVASPVEGGLSAGAGASDSAAHYRAESVRYKSAFDLQTQRFMAATAELTTTRNDRDDLQRALATSEQRADFQERRADDLAAGLAALSKAASPKKFLGLFHISPTAYFIAGGVTALVGQTVVERITPR